MKVTCAPKGVIVQEHADIQYILYDYASASTIGSVGQKIIPTIKRLEIQPAVRAWDLLSIALAVEGADEGCTRDTTADGWCRDIELTVAVNDAEFWMSYGRILEDALRFLTTDRWTLSFVAGGILPEPPKKLADRPEDAVCLLSGGVDSLVGALDLRAVGKKPLLVSQIAKGDKTFQRELGQAIGENNLHLQLNHNASPPPGFSERSQRARSLVFIAYGVLAATSLNRYREGQDVELFIPENGFISLNVPLTPLRLASHSTRTTHPFYIAKIQRMLEVAGLNVRLINPYQFLTKGEMLAACKDQSSLMDYAGKTTSCGRYARHTFQHCGRCVPCLIRRAAFQRWGIPDPTPSYRYKNIGSPGTQFRDFDDVRSVAVAIQTVRTRGLDAWIGGALNRAQLGNIASYRDIIAHGVEELEVFMKAAGVI